MGARGRCLSGSGLRLPGMGSTPLSLRVGDPPTERLKAYRRKYGGGAQLRALIVKVVESRMDLGAMAYVLKHRAPKDLEAIERALVVQLADLEEALAHVQRMRHFEQMAVTSSEYTTQHPELVEILRDGS